MCGIVLAGGNALASRDIDYFEKMLYCDTFRGDHSTGVYAGFKPVGKDFTLKMEKAALAGDEFLRSHYWSNVKELRTAGVTAGSSVVHQPKFLVGHNRYATQGAVNNRNAHPFQHGHITLVHNGTLTDQSLLPDHTRFQVDSENIAWSISKIGAAETIQKLNGAFTLVWHDANEQTLNIIRNDERPFHLVELSTGEWFGASEEAMIMWILTRKKFNPTIKRHFECEVGTQYVFDVSEGFKFKEELKHELPTFRTAYSGNRRGWYSQWDDYDEYYGTGSAWERHGSRSHSSVSNGVGSGSMSSAMNDKYKTQNDMLEQFGLSDHRIGYELKFDGFQFDPYQANPAKGKLTGYVTNVGDYIEVQAHNFDSTDYIGEDEYRGKIVSCYIQNYMLVIIVSNAVINSPGNNTITVGELVEKMTELGVDTPPDDEEHLPSIVANTQQKYESVLTQEELNEQYAENEEEAEDDNAEVEITQDGTVFTKKEWESNGSLNCCANCGSPIPFDDVPDAVYVPSQDVAYCGECYEHGAIDGYPKAKGSEPLTLRFDCISCAQDLPIDLESEKEGMCLQCYSQFYHVLDKVDSNLLEYRKKLKNGMRVTPQQWNSMNVCSFCNESIEWKYASITHFVGQRPCCALCNHKLEIGIVPKPNTDGK